MVWYEMHFNLLHKDCNLKANCNLGPSYFTGCISSEISAHRVSVALYHFYSSHGFYMFGSQNYIVFFKSKSL